MHCTALSASRASIFIFISPLPPPAPPSSPHLCMSGLWTLAFLGSRTVVTDLDERIMSSAPNNSNLHSKQLAIIQADVLMVISLIIICWNEYRQRVELRICKRASLIINCRNKQGNSSLRRPPKLVIPQAVIDKDGLLYIQTCTSKQSYTARVRVDCAV